MTVIKKLVAIGQVKKTRADSVESDFRASSQEIRLTLGAGCWAVSLLVPFVMAVYLIFSPCGLANSGSTAILKASDLSKYMCFLSLSRKFWCFRAVYSLFVACTISALGSSLNDAFLRRN